MQKKVFLYNCPHCGRLVPTDSTSCPFCKGALTPISVPSQDEEPEAGNDASLRPENTSEKAAVETSPDGIKAPHDVSDQLQTPKNQTSDGSVPSTGTSAPPVNVYTKPQTYTHESSNSDAVFWAILCTILFILAIGAAVFFIYIKNAGDKTDNQNQPQEGENNKEGEDNGQGETAKADPIDTTDESEIETKATPEPVVLSLSEVMDKVSITGSNIKDIDETPKEEMDGETYMWDIVWEGTITVRNDLDIPLYADDYSCLCEIHGGGFINEEGEWGDVIFDKLALDGEYVPAHGTATLTFQYTTQYESIEGTGDCSELKPSLHFNMKSINSHQ